MPHSSSPQLVGDIGGTHTRLALATQGQVVPGSAARLKNAEFPGLGAVIRHYLDGRQVSAACLAVAGPVRAGTVSMTNLGWSLSESELAALSGAKRVVLLNDLQAQGHALASLPASAFQPLLRRPRTEGPVLVVGIGTGFNAVPVHRHGALTLVPPSEAGHIHLPQGTDEERALARDLAAQHGVATLEEVLSGRGLMALHTWLGGAPCTAAELVAALARGEAQAQATGRLFAALLGRALASLALVHLPYGGIYLIGGPARAVTPHLLDLGLAEAFDAMGRQSPLMQAFALDLVTDDEAALLGCAACLAVPPEA